MNSTTNTDKDPMGHAIKDFYSTGKASKLRVFSSLFYEDEIPVATLFRKIEDMPPQEQEAIRLCRGNVLDVGAGAGCHSLEIMKRGLNVTAIDISKISVDIMLKRGINAHITNFFDENFIEKFDTILMAMNGIGIVGKIENLPHFFTRVKQLLKPNGQLLLDSSDIKYIFEEDDGSININIAGGYYGELDYRMQYKNIKGEKFEWLYIDFNTLSMYAEQYGLKCRKCVDGKHYDYLAQITRKI